MFCRKRKTGSVQTTLDLVLDFLTTLYDSGLGYSAINTSRSALSSLGIIIDGFVIGSHPIVIRFLKGIYNLRPSMPRYVTTWDVSKVLKYLKSLSPVKYLTLKLLTFKLAMLLCLILAGRTQTLHLLSIQGMVKRDNVYVLQFKDFLKQSRPGNSNAFVELKAYRDKQLCCITVLKEYLHRTVNLRGNNHDLFISYVKPHLSVTKTTISRWLKTVMVKSGIDINKYTVHSIRSASASKAKFNSVPIEVIMKSVGWSSDKTFAKFYDKVIEPDTFQSAVLT